MKNRSRNLAHAALIAALYAAMAHLQNLLLPGSASWAIQCRLSEALCVLALFTPAAVSGLSIGCALFNMTFAAALPLDWLLGAAATFGATLSMRALRRIRIGDYPLPAMLMPALFNAVLIGLELSAYIGGGFLLNACYVALGELIVMLTFGSVLLRLFKKRNLAHILFHKK